VTGTKARREEAFIKLFLSAYEDGSWADAQWSQPDKIIRSKPAVDGLATRKSDNKTLAIEHTIVEPFVGEKSDLAFFLNAAFLEIERDASLPVPGLWIQVFVPVGTLKNQPTAARRAIVQSVHSWIKANRLLLRHGDSELPCTITGLPGKAEFDITLTIRVVPLETGARAETGILHIRRQQVQDTLDEIIEKALREKLPKLVNTDADKRILMLERQHMILDPDRILQEVEKQQGAFPELARVDEIWILESPFYGKPFGNTTLGFVLYERGATLQSFYFNEGKLV
jgi:hypothetical protein